MPITTSIIETGVDKLVNLIKERGKISIPDAAKQLGTSTQVVGEWADFLEEEGIISIQHTLTKPYLVERKLTKKEVESKAKEFEGKKDVFVRKAEVTVNFLEKEAGKLKDVKTEFDKIRKGLGFDLGEVRKELDELHKYEQLKISFDKKVQEQKESAKSKIGELSERILKEHRKYQQLLQKIRSEEEELRKEKEDALSIEESEKLLKKRLEEMKSTINMLEQKIDAENERIRNSESHVERLKNLVEQIKIRAEKEKGMIEPLVEKSVQHEKKILELQDRVLRKIGEKERKLQAAKKVSKKFKEFFDRKMRVISLIDKLHQDRDALEMELMELVKKAKSFQLTSKSADVGKEILDLEKKFIEVDKKRKVFEEEYKKLGEELKA